jgi:hypothetical protein
MVVTFNKAKALVSIPNCVPKSARVDVAAAFDAFADALFARALRLWWRRLRRYGVAVCEAFRSRSASRRAARAPDARYRAPVRGAESAWRGPTLHPPLPVALALQCSARRAPASIGRRAMRRGRSADASLFATVVRPPSPRVLPVGAGRAEALRHGKAVSRVVDAEPKLACSAAVLAPLRDRLRHAEGVGRLGGVASQASVTRVAKGVV